MSLYITKENQDLLWNVIHKNESMKKQLQTLQVEQKIIWFRQIIEKFYRENENKPIDKKLLISMNKQTISHMIKDLRKNNNSNSIKTEFNETPLEINNLQEIETPPVVKNNKQDIYLSEFEKRQQEYSSMINKKLPETIDFSESTEGDQVITNMEELIKEQVAARQLDMENIQMSVHPKENEVEILKIEENTNIHIESHELEMQNAELASLLSGAELAKLQEYQERQGFAQGGGIAVNTFNTDNSNTDNSNTNTTGDYNVEGSDSTAKILTNRYGDDF